MSSYRSQAQQYSTRRHTAASNTSVNHNHAKLALFAVSVTVVLVHGQVTIIFVVSVCLFVCAEFFLAVFDPISIKLGHILYVWV